MGEFDLTVGVVLLGLLVNTYLYGLVTYQFLLYRITNFNDALWLKSIVGVLFLVDTVHSMVAVYAGWDMCIVNYGNPASLGVVGWPIPFTAVSTSMAAVLTQSFLCHRVYKLTKNIPIIVLIGVLSSLGFFFGAYAGVRAGIIKQVSEFAPLNPFVTCWLGFQTSADLVITAVLTYSLAHSRTGFRSTDSVINRLIRGTIQTGLFASMFALADLFSFVFHRNTDLYALFAYPLGRIYTNTLLDTLNSRIELKIMSHNVYDESDRYSREYNGHCSWLRDLITRPNNRQLDYPALGRAVQMPYIRGIPALSEKPGLMLDWTRLDPVRLEE